MFAERFAGSLYDQKMAAVHPAWISAFAGLGGAIVGGSAVIVADHIRWNRQRRARWETEKLMAITDFVAYMFKTREMVTQRRPDDMLALRNISNEMSSRMLQLRIVSSDALFDKAGDVSTAMFAYLGIPTDKRPVHMEKSLLVMQERGADESDRLMDAIAEAVTALVVEAKRELRIKQ